MKIFQAGPQKVQAVVTHLCRTSASDVAFYVYSLDSVLCKDLNA